MKSETTRMAIIVATIIGMSILGYGYMDYKYKKEALREKIRSEEQTKLEKEEEKQKLLETQKANQTKLAICLNDADDTYHENWLSECESQGLLTAECIKFLKLSFTEFVSQKEWPKDTLFSEQYDEYSDKKQKCSCRLSFANGDRIEGWRKDAKNECYKKYPQ